VKEKGKKAEDHLDSRSERDEGIVDFPAVHNSKNETDTPSGKSSHLSLQPN